MPTRRPIRRLSVVEASGWSAGGTIYKRGSQARERHGAHLTLVSSPPPNSSDRPPPAAAASLGKRTTLFVAAAGVAASLGLGWALSRDPSGELAGKLPLVASIAGLLVTALLASLVHVSQVSRGRAAALERVNDRLRERIQTTAQDEAEIRHLNAALEARVAERTAALRETIAELETFNYSVSHDLRSPLGAILNFTAILTEDYAASLDDAGRTYLQRISKGATSVVSLMDGLLAFSRSGREELHRAHIDVKRMVESLRDETLDAKGVGSCKIQVGDLPPASADPAMLRLVFSNLIANACKFVRKDESAHVEVGGAVEGGDLVYFVRDHGIGFDMRFAEKLFRVFERLHATEDYEGHGVGLAIVARLVRRHGGTVWAEGAPGKGATFYLRLPLENGHAERTVADA